MEEITSEHEDMVDTLMSRQNVSDGSIHCVPHIANFI